MNRLLDKFLDWFCSRAGVWQVAIGCVAIVSLEQVKVIPDPNGFWLLYWLTVWSAVTQNALAMVSRETGDKTDKVLEHIEDEVEDISEELEDK